jgi:hypothetical protein
LRKIQLKPSLLAGKLTLLTLHLTNSLNYKDKFLGSPQLQLLVRFVLLKYFCLSQIRLPNNCFLINLSITFWNSSLRDGDKYLYVKLCLPQIWLSDCNNKNLSSLCDTVS